MRWRNSVPHSCRPEAFSSCRLVHGPCHVVPSEGRVSMIVACFLEASRRGSPGRAGEVAPDCGSDPRHLWWSPLARSKSQVHLQWREEGITPHMKMGDQPRVCLPHYVFETEVTLLNPVKLSLSCRWTHGVDFRQPSLLVRVIAGGLIHFFPGSKRKQLVVWSSGEAFIILLPIELNCVGLRFVPRMQVFLNDFGFLNFF